MILPGVLFLNDSSETLNGTIKITGLFPHLFIHSPTCDS